ncbi:ABC transporter permease [Paenibacillus thalictri]|uniref:ABC transporter permease n=1 Tax=Paenibacillus thalictri TaxID=2527873 RepID=A0A4Q9DQW4_9BACL|nr:ABC transporter permease [Paenibacillus thalictri]TBL76541.1 ABC transporter permease [Paenibacillus thalictri]
MNKTVFEKITEVIYTYASVILFVLVFAVFSMLSDKFLDLKNIINILQQSSSIGIVAIGMTFVLLVAGIDLSVGSIMFICATIAAKMLQLGLPIWASVIMILAAGLLVGWVNGYVSYKFKIMAFIVTLGMLYICRGLGLMITNTREIKLPEAFLKIGFSSVAGIPVPVLLFAVVILISYFVLKFTTFGRQVYAVGNDPDGAKKAGIPVRRILIGVYVISGFAAALGGLVAIAQLGTVAPKFGDQREFIAVAAAVLGGTSLFGGRGNIFPGTVLGTILILMIENGLVIINADPYIYPIISGGVIFLAVFIDSVRNKQLEKLGKRKIRTARQS